MSAETKRADILVAAIQYALIAEDGLEWLRCWNEGEPTALKELEDWIQNRPRIFS